MTPVGDWNEVEDVGVNANRGLRMVLVEFEWGL